MRRVLFVAVVLTGVVLPAATAAGGGCHDMTRRERSGTTVELTERCFQPNVLHVAPGTTVRFVNVDETEHIITGVGIRDGWPTLAAGQSVEKRFDEPGTQTYMCHIHPGMSGAVVVGEPKLAAAAQPVESDGGDGISLVPVALALFAGAAAGAAIGRRRVASSG